MGFTVETDLPRRLLTMTYTQDVTPEEAKSSAEDVQKLLVDMKPGFRLLTDVTGLDKMDPACSPYMKQIMDLSAVHGVGLVVRVITDPHKDIGFNIMSLFHYTRAVVIVTCSTWDEANRALAD